MTHLTCSTLKHRLTAYLNFDALHTKEDSSRLPKVILKGLYVCSSTHSTTRTANFEEVTNDNARWDLSLLSALRDLTMRSKHLVLIYGCVMDARDSINHTKRFLVTEFCSGGSLKEGIALRARELRKDMRLSTKIAKWSERVGWALDICSALSYLKQKNLYHGNLKSSNCMLYLSQQQISIMERRESLSDIDDDIKSSTKRKNHSRRITPHDMYVTC